MDKFNDFIGGHLNIDITKNLLKPFGADQVVPTTAFTEILVSMDLNEDTEDSIDANFFLSLSIHRT